MDPEIQRMIDDIQEEIRELTLVMRNLGNVLSATAEAEIKAFSEKTKEAGTTVAKTNKLLDQFGKEISSTTEAIEEQTAAVEHHSWCIWPTGRISLGRGSRTDRS